MFRPRHIVKCLLFIFKILKYDFHSLTDQGFNKNLDTEQSSDQHKAPNKLLGQDLDFILPEK